MGNFPSISDEARMYQLLEANAKEMVLHMTGCSGEPGELPGLEWYTDGDGKDFHTGQRPTEHVRCLMQVVHILLLMRVHVPRCATVTRTSFSCSTWTILAQPPCTFGIQMWRQSRGSGVQARCRFQKLYTRRHCA